VLRFFGSSFVRLRVHRFGSRASDRCVSLARSAAYSSAVRRSRPPRPGPWIGACSALSAGVCGLVARRVVNGVPPSVAAATDCPQHRRRSSPGRPPGRRGRAAPPRALRPPRGHGAPPRSSIGIMVSQRSRRLWRRGLTSTRDDPVVAKPVPGCSRTDTRFRACGLSAAGSAGVGGHLPLLDLRVWPARPVGAAGAIGVAVLAAVLGGGMATPGHRRPGDMRVVRLRAGRGEFGDPRRCGPQPAVPCCLARRRTNGPGRIRCDAERTALRKGGNHVEELGSHGEGNERGPHRG
jgi:hypothetical protein